MVLPVLVASQILKHIAAVRRLDWFSKNLQLDHFYLLQKRSQKPNYHAKTLTT